ncbi:hypothetical protein [Hymenobacter rubripertinctus]|uniref:Uncharacterized protein n=1 Tax=Hymenobacter rubripertinctus TaxID=2029981 RepID=A0A418R6G7_9BACT|nr:hypothetical protein [Hymenobacter rubripertinctus]RIY12992.1 hypothetical protein D0T11_04485 [Hymenobacter rubripertinctus]
MAIDPNDRPVRVINDDTTDQEMNAGHLVPGADPPKNEDARGGFGNRDGKQGFGTDSSNGVTAVSMNQNEDKVAPPDDNMRTSEEGRPNRPNQDLPDRDLTQQPRRPVDELDGDDARAGRDEMEDPDSRVGMGQMEANPPSNVKLASQGTNADLTDPDATDTAIVQ